MRPARPIRPKGATENDDDKVVSPLADYIREPIGGNRCSGRKKKTKKLDRKMIPDSRFADLSIVRTCYSFNFK